MNVHRWRPIFQNICSNENIFSGNDQFNIDQSRVQYLWICFIYEHSWTTCRYASWFSLTDWKLAHSSVQLSIIVITGINRVFVNDIWSLICPFLSLLDTGICVVRIVSVHSSAHDVLSALVNKHKYQVGECWHRPENQSSCNIDSKSRIKIFRMSKTSMPVVPSSLTDWIKLYMKRAWEYVELIGQLTTRIDVTNMFLGICVEDEFL